MIKTFFFVFCRQEGNCQYGAKCTREQKHYHDDHDCTWLVVMENLLKKIAFKSNLQGLSFVMVLEAYISYLMCALVMLISSVFFSLVFFYFCLPFLF